MPTAADIPLHVYEVLEEEYISLHGPMPAGEVSLVELPDERGLDAAGAHHTRVVEAARDWRFRRGHVKDPLGLAADLLLEAGDAGAQGDAAMRAVSGSRDDLTRANLRKYLVGPEGIPRATLAALAAWEPADDNQPEPPRDLVGPLEEALNRLLKDQDLYRAERFSKNWLGPAGRGLADLRDAGHTFAGPEDPAAAAAGWDEEAGAWEYRTPLAHLNRVLLEDAFPDYIERTHDIRLAAVYQRLHEVGPAALSLSGGGIRSGTFALGLLQGLARHDLLKEFDYLSTVSGGGYIGGWLTAWLHRHPEGLRGVTHDLKNSDPVSKIDPDAKPLQYLRTYSNFITPKAGFLTADTWTFIGIYLRNLLLNWLVFIPLLLAVLMLPRLMLTATMWQPVGDPVPASVWVAQHNVAPEQLDRLKDVAEARRVVYRPTHLVENFFGRPDPGRPPGSDDDRHLYLRHLLLLAGLLLGVWALGYVGFSRPGLRGVLQMRRPFWYDRADQGGFLTYCLAPLLVSAALLTTYFAWSQEGAGVSKNILVFILFGVAFTIGGRLVASLVMRRLFEPNQSRWREVAMIVGAGAVGGFLFWLVSLFDLGNPVIGYGLGVRDGKVARTPFAWTDWTSWGWSSWTTELYVCVGVPVFLLIYWASTAFFVGVSSKDKRIDDEDREWWARFGAWLLIAALAWAAAGAVVIFGPLALLESPKLLGAVGGLSGLVALLVGRSALTPAGGKAGDKNENKKAGAAAGLLGSALPLLALVFLAAFLALLSLAATGLTAKIASEIDEATREEKGRQPGAVEFVELLTNVPNDDPQKGPVANRGFDDYLRYITPVVPTLVRPAPTPQPEAPACQPVCTSGPAGLDEGWKLEEADAYTGAQIVHLNVLHHTSLLFNAFLAALFFAVGWRLSRRINLNLFSIHAGYRDRLIRGFLGASRPAGERRPNPFTGFDPADNIHMHELRWALFDEADLLDPSKLAKLLKGEPPAAATAPGQEQSAELQNRDPLSEYLRGREGLLKELRLLDYTETSPRLTKALRTDLNRVLEQEKLYLEDFGADYLKSRRAVAVRREILSALRKTSGDSRDDVPLGDIPLRSDYSILLNRLVLEEAYPNMFRPGVPPPYKLMHVVNTSLNLVGGDKLAWQQRKAEPFSVSPLHSGCFRIGYRPSLQYGGADGISLGTAAAISGAAASSNMGYYTTSPLISLLLTLFNVRLGWWLGNPGPGGGETYRLRAPSNSVTPVLSEAFGLTNDRHPYVYLTDGGHFENLAIYEMVLRRCRVIVCSDGAQDGEYRFGDLGNAVRKIRIDLGIPIDFPCVEIYGPQTQKEEKEGKPGMYCAVGRIRYSDVDWVKPQKGEGEGEEKRAERAPDGLLLYIKPAVYGDEPRDVLEYKKSFPAFPHQSTGDQFFDEPQFESYRSLGSHIMDQLCGEGFRALELRQVIERARAAMLERCARLDDELLEKPGDDFIKWVWQLTGETPPVAPPDAAPTPAGQAAKSRAPRRRTAARKPELPGTVEEDEPAPAQSTRPEKERQEGGEPSADAPADRARPPEEEME